MGIGAAIFESAGIRSTHYVPGVYTRQKNISNPSGISSGNLCILGQSAGGEPFKLLEFSNISEAKDTLLSGDLLTAVAYAFKCSKEGLTPSVVYAMRTNSATNAKAELENTSGNKTFVIESNIYGSQSNQIKITVTSGASGTDITMAYKDDEYSQTNIIRKSISIVNVGSKSQKIAIDAEKVTLTWTESSATKTLDLDFVSYPTLSELAGAINETNYFTATLIDVRSGALSSELDQVSSTSITSSITLYSNTAAEKEFIESVPFVKSVTINANLPLKTVSQTYFTGGTTSVADITSLQTALTALESEDIQIIATPETDPEIATAILGHCEEMSSVDNRKERTCLLGGKIGISDSDGIANAQALNSIYASYVIDNCSAYNPLTNKKETISGAIVACMLAGIEAAVSPNVPLTKKKLNVLGCSTKRTISNMNTLIKNGIMVVNNDPENMTNYVCIRGLTTYQDDDLISCERSMTREALFMARDLRRKTSGKIGGVGSATSIADVIQTLNDVAAEWATKGYIIAGDEGNVWDIQASIDGDKITLDYSVYLAAPINFIFITSNNHVYSASVTL